MRKESFRTGLVGVFLCCIIACATTSREPDTDALLGTASIKRVLILAVSFPDVNPSASLSMIRGRVLDSASKYYDEVSYGKTRIIGDVKGWYSLPHHLDYYKLPPYIFERDNRSRVWRLVEDALNTAEKDLTYKNYDLIIIVVGVYTTFRKGYGQHALCANPGYMSLGTGIQMEEVVTNGGQRFKDGIVVIAPNTHPGNVVHDMAHAMGGVVKGQRVVPDLYSHKLFDKAMAEIDRGKAPRPSLKSWDELTAKFAVHMGPWDVMSLWWIKYNSPPQGMSSFTRLRMGWIEDDQVVLMSPDERRAITLSPLTSGKGTLVVKIPVGERSYYLLENRQKEGMDSLMPTTGLLVLQADESIRDEDGIVRIVDANPKVLGLRSATFGVKRNQNPSVNLQQNGAVEVLWQRNKALTVLVTTHSKDSEIQEMAKHVRETYAKSGLTEAKELLTRMGLSDHD